MDYVLRETAKCVVVAMSDFITEGRPSTPPVEIEGSIDEVMESSTNEASRYKLRLRPGGCPVGIALALSWLWQDLNHEGVDPRHNL